MDADDGLPRWTDPLAGASVPAVDRSRSTPDGLQIGLDIPRPVSPEAAPPPDYCEKCGAYLTGGMIERSADPSVCVECAEAAPPHCKLCDGEKLVPHHTGYRLGIALYDWHPCPQCPEAAPPRATTARNPTCTIPGCDCQNGPPIDRCAECEAALPHHRDTCSKYTSNRGYGVPVRAPLAAHPATTPEPMTDDADATFLLNYAAALRRSASALRERGSLFGPECVDVQAPIFERIAARLRSPSRESGALLDDLIKAAWAFGITDREYERGEISREVYQQLLAKQNAAEGLVRSRLSTLERDAARTREAATRFATDLVEGYDHEDDAHRHKNGACRVCKAEAFLAALTPSGEPTTTPSSQR